MMKVKAMDLINSTEAIVADIDNTLCPGAVMERVGFGYARDEAFRGHAGNVIAGVKGILKIETLLRCEERTCNKELELMGYFYSILKSRNLGRESEIGLYATNYLEDEMFDVIRKIFAKFSGPKFIVTLEGSTVAMAVARYVGAADFVSNIDVFNERGMLQKLEKRIYDAKTKTKFAEDMLSKYDLDLSKCTVIADDPVIDEGILKKAGVSVSPPRAKKGAIERTMIHL